MIKEEIEDGAELTNYFLPSLKNERTCILDDKTKASNERATAFLVKLLILYFLILVFLVIKIHFIIKEHLFIPKID